MPVLGPNAEQTQVPTSVYWVDNRARDVQVAHAGGIVAKRVKKMIVKEASRRESP